MTNLLLWLTFGLITKHFVFDFPLQGPFQYLNKGTYGHFGGILHAGLQGLGTTLALSIILPSTYWHLIGSIAIIESLIHYHIDWAKMNINRHFGLMPNNSEKFWWLLGFDQYLHYLTYLGILWYISVS